MRTDKWAVILLDHHGKVAGWSDAATDLVGRPAEDAIGCDLDDLFAERDSLNIVEGLAQARAQALRPAPVLLVHRRRIASEPPATGGLLRLTFVLARDERVAVVVGERGRRPGVGERGYGVLEEIGHQVAEGVLLASAETLGNGPRVLYANEAARAVLGDGDQELTGRPLFELLDPARTRGLREKVLDEIARERDGVLEQVTLERADGRRIRVEWTLRAVRNAQGEVTQYVSVQRDVSDDAARGGPARGAEVDPLTGLPNRTHFLARLERSVGWARRGDHYAFSVLGFELTELDQAERRWGHAVANLLVEALAWRVRRCLRPNDLVARVGHQRLAVLLEHHAEEWDVDELLERIRREISVPYVIGGQRLSQSVLGGALPVLRGANMPGDAESILDEVERGLAGRGPPGFSRVRVGPAAAGPASGTTGLDVRRALAREELRLRYQPIVRIASGEVVGLEALLAWQHPEKGLLPARAFLHHAEGTGLMSALGEWVIDRACGDARRWRDTSDGGGVPRIHVNLSAAEFWAPDLSERLCDALVRGGLSVNDFRLEVSEGTLSRNPAAASASLEALVEAGFEPWLEGFGGGRLSMRDILWMPIRCFKLDPGLLWEGSGSGGRKPSRFLTALARLAQELEREVVAGSVETEEECRSVRTACCGFGQGSFFGDPVDADSVPGLTQHAAGITPP